MSHLAPIFVLAVVTALLTLARGHGYLQEPLARTSLELRPELGAQPPFWEDNEGVWCGNAYQNADYTTCGRCGDTPGETTANQGGLYDKGIIVTTYASGSVIDIVAQFRQPHFGHFLLELCPNLVETDDCFQKLAILDASQEVRDGTRVCVLKNGAPDTGSVTAKVWLPIGVRCERCTLRWTYRTSYLPHGTDDGKDFCDDPNDA